MTRRILAGTIATITQPTDARILLPSPVGPAATCILTSTVRTWAMAPLATEVLFRVHQTAKSRVGTWRLSSPPDPASSTTTGIVKPHRAFGDTNPAGPQHAMWTTPAISWPTHERQIGGLIRYSVDSCLRRRRWLSDKSRR